jgi:predicted RNA-binding Zn ribbon-like protein
VVRAVGNPVRAVLAVLAEEALILFAGPRQYQLCACRGPGCVLFFVRDHPHRQWCSASCGNRARAARYYAKTRRTRSR